MESAELDLIKVLARGSLVDIRDEGSKETGLALGERQLMVDKFLY